MAEEAAEADRIRLAKEAHDASEKKKAEEAAEAE